MAEKAEDLNLPLTVVTRIIKEALPPGVIVSKEARVAISRAASVFVLHTTNFANQNALLCKRKTVTGQDVIEGVRELEMENFVTPLQEALESWKSTSGQKASRKKSSTGQTAKKAAETANTSNLGEGEGGEKSDDEDESDEPPRKKGGVETYGADKDSDEDEDENSSDNENENSTTAPGDVSNENENKEEMEDS